MDGSILNPLIECFALPHEPLPEKSERHIALPPAGHDLIIVYGNDGLVHHLAKDAIINAGRIQTGQKP